MPLLLAGRDQAALHAELLHRAGEVEAVQQRRRSNRSPMPCRRRSRRRRRRCSRPPTRRSPRRPHRRCFLCSAFRRRISSLIMPACTGLPPGELKRSTTACAFGSSKAPRKPRQQVLGARLRVRRRSRRAPRSARCAGRSAWPTCGAGRDDRRRPPARRAAARTGGRTAASAARGAGPSDSRARSARATGHGCAAGGPARTGRRRARRIGRRQERLGAAHGFAPGGRCS